MSQLLAQMLAGDANAAQAMKQQMKRVDAYSKNKKVTEGDIAAFKATMESPAPKMQVAESQQAFIDPTARMASMSVQGGAAFPNTNTRLPQQIVESMAQNPVNPQLAGAGVLDSGPSIEALLAARGMQTAAPINQVNEVMQTVQPAAAPVNTASINYEMIQAIVENIVKKYTSALKQQVLKEINIPQGINEGQVLQVGNGFTVVAKNGDIYRIAFEKQGNINESKK